MTINSPVRFAAKLSVGILLAAALTACGSEADETPDSENEGAGTRELTVLAAASLTETFTELGEQFEEQNDDVDVEFSFGSSATLVQQVAEGGPGDVLATADEVTMETVVDEELNAAEPQIFATNELVMAVPAANEAGIETLKDIESKDVDFVVCVPDAPCGRLAEMILKDQGIKAKPASQEIDVKATLGKLTADEADAGFVYATDVVAAGDTVTGIDIGGADFLTNYPIVALTQAEDPTLAEEFVAFVLSEGAGEVFADAGFGTP